MSSEKDKNDLPGTPSFSDGATKPSFSDGDTKPVA